MISWADWAIRSLVKTRDSLDFTEGKILWPIFQPRMYDGLSHQEHERPSISLRTHTIISQTTARSSSTSISTTNIPTRKTQSIMNVHSLSIAASGSITFQPLLVESMAVDLKVVPNSLPSTLMTNNLFNDMAVVGDGKARQRGKEAYLSAESIHKIKETMGILPVSSPEGTFVATTKIKKTTQRHTDYYTDAQGVARPAEKATAIHE